MISQRKLTSIYSAQNFVSNNQQFSHHKAIFGHTSCVNSTAVSPDQNWLASAGDDKRILLWDVKKALLEAGADDIRQLQKSQSFTSKQAHLGNIYKVDFLDSGKILSAGARGGSECPGSPGSPGKKWLKTPIFGLK